MPSETSTNTTEQPFGFTAGSAAQQLAAEARLRELLAPEVARRHSQALAAEPHVAGTDAQARTRDYVLQDMAECGLETAVAEYEAFLPHVTRCELEQIAPQPRQFALTEPAVHGDDATLLTPALIPQHAYAAAGDAVGSLVYVNYATPQDLEQLAELGVSLQGRVAIARYGHIFRGLKVLNVQAAGAVACLLFCDPFDDGYFRGDVYPNGPMRPETGLQTGSLHCGPPGDVHRDGAQPPYLPRIPSIPIRGDTARTLLAELDGPSVPQPWQGAFPFRYHVGGEAVRVRVAVEREESRRQIWNTLGTIRGEQHPDQQIIIGAHRDAWTTGAADNVSGVVSVLLAARWCAALRDAGWAPARTLVFATWDAEEWGIIGSGEYVRANADHLAESTIAYLNQDMSAFGPNFVAGASPGLRRFLEQCTLAIPDPHAAGRSVHDVWGEKTGQSRRVGVLGGGSDHEAFLLHVGIPAAGFGFTGQMGVYHSLYDTTAWMERFGDPDYHAHAAAGGLTALAALRLGNADLLPFDYAPYADEIRQELGDSAQALADCDVPAAPILAAVADFEAAAGACAGAITTTRGLGQETLNRANAHLCRVERMFIGEPPPDAGPDERFLRHVVLGIEPTSLYGLQRLPGLARALTAGDKAAAGREAERLAMHLGRAAEELRAATKALGTA